MYADLATGAIRRTMVKADLNVADSDGASADGLHAAPMTGAVENVNGIGAERSAGIRQTNPAQYVPFTGALQTLLPVSANRDVVAPMAANPRLLPSAALGAGNFD